MLPMRYVIVFNPNTCSQTCHSAACSAATDVEGLRVRGEEFHTVAAAFESALFDERERSACDDPLTITKVYGWKVHKCTKV